MTEQYQGQPAEGYKPLEEWGAIEALSDEELEAWKRSPVARLESRVIATIARLQEQVEEAEAQRDAAMTNMDAARTERDKAEALAERRKKALEGLLDYVTEMAARVRWQPREMLPDKRIGAARAAIEEEPR